MKIILKAFKGKLVSPVIEWPDETPLDIHLPLDIDILKFNVHQDSYDTIPAFSKIGVFRSSFMHQQDGKDYVREYILVDIL